MLSSLTGKFWNTIDACFGVPVTGEFNQNVGIVGDTYEHASIEPICSHDDWFITGTAGIEMDTTSIGFD